VYDGRMSDVTTYTGGCHCGKVRFQVTTKIEGLGSCNCSICAKAGWLLTFAPASAFELISGEGELSDYQFHKKQIHHTFCKTCGIRSFARGAGPDGTEMVCINARCLDGLDVSAYPVKEFDGASL
jgi:hypothetical protein